MPAAAPRNPPYRAEQIGSLLRPPALKTAREQRQKGAIGRDPLRMIEDTAIRDAVRLQEEVGLPVITDGEFRRHTYFTAFFEALGKLAFQPDAGEGWNYTDRSGHQVGAGLPRVASRLCWTRPVHADDVKFLRGLTRKPIKVTLPGPAVLHFFGGRRSISAIAYPDLDEFWDDIVNAFQQEFGALLKAGCGYVQLDETCFAKFGDPKIRAALDARGDKWQDVLDLYIKTMIRVMAGRPPGLSVGLHMCRGNKRGYWQADGGYELVAERMFNEIGIDFFLLEYDSPRAGDFAPLRFMPKGKSAVLGLVSTKTPELEAKDELKRRIDDAARHVDPDRLGISPQCGFASDFVGNPLTIEQEKAKLRLVVEVAREVWGSV